MADNTLRANPGDINTEAKIDEEEKKREAILQLADFDPEFAVIFKDPHFVSPFPPIADLVTRKIDLGPHVKAYLASQPIPDGLEITERSILSLDGSGYRIPFRTYVPNFQDKTGNHPVFFMIHGGGFCIGSMDEEELNCRELAVQFGFSVVNVEYRLAPEHPYPIGLNDTFEVLKWTVRESSLKELHGDTSKGFIISGNSSGGNFSAVISLWARNSPLFLDHQLTGTILQIPNTCDPLYPHTKYRDQFLSYKQNTHVPILNQADVLLLRGPTQMPTTRPCGYPDASPLLAQSHKGLPPTFIQVAGADPLRDDGIVYEMVLRQAGVPTRIEVYPGVPHGFHNAFSHLTISQKWRDDLKEGITWLLGFSKQAAGTSRVRR